MAKEKTVTILDDSGTSHEYKFIARGAEEGVALMAEISAFAPAAISLYGAVAGGPDVSPQAFDQLAPSIARALSPELMRKVLKHAERDRQLACNVFNTAYQANYGELVEALKHALQVDFGSLSTLGKRLSLGDGSAGNR